MLYILLIRLVCSIVARNWIDNVTQSLQPNAASHHSKMVQRGDAWETERYVLRSRAHWATCEGHSYRG